jgi:hypothetical protein
MKKVGGGSDGGRTDCWMGGSLYILTMGDVNKPPLCNNFKQPFVHPQSILLMTYCTLRGPVRHL